jgi:hypothetical protein
VSLLQYVIIAYQKYVVVKKTEGILEREHVTGLTREVKNKKKILMTFYSIFQRK